MAKRLHEIKKFNVGTVLTPSDTDIPEEAASYSENIDPMAQDGVLKGINSDIIKRFRDTGDTVYATWGTDNANGATTLITTGGSISSFASSGNIIFVDDQGYVQVLAYTGKVNGNAELGVNATLTGVSGWHTEFGKLIDDTIVYQYGSATNFISDSSALINNNGTRHLVYFENSDNRFRKIDEYYGESSKAPLLKRISDTQFDHTGTPCMVKNNKEVHVGMGGGNTDKPQWIGFQTDGQWGAPAETDLIISDAELHSPNQLKSFHKTVEYGSYVFGIEFDGTKIYYIDKTSENYSIFSAPPIFTATKAIALDHNNYLMIVDNNDRLKFIDLSSNQFGIVKDYAISRAGASVPVETTDIIETGSSSSYKIWIAQAGSATSHNSSTGTPPQAATGKGILQNVDYPSGTTGTLSFADKTPWQGFKESLSLSDHAIGHWYHSNNTNGTSAPSSSYNGQVAIYTYPISLVKSSDNDWCGFICEFAGASRESARIALNCLSNSTTSSAVPHQLVDMNGPVLNWIHKDYAPVYHATTIGNCDPDETKWFPVRLKHESDTSLDIIGKWGNVGDLSNAVAQSTYNNITSIYSHKSGSAADRIFIGLNTEGSSASTDTKILALNYTDVTPSGGTIVGNHWFATDNTSTWIQNSTPTVFHYAQEHVSDHVEGRLATNVHSGDASKIANARISSNDTGFTYTIYLNSGTGNGKMASLSATAVDTYTSWTALASEVAKLTLDQSSASANTDFSTSSEYFYKVSFTYDGYQESPMGFPFQLASPVQKDVDITITINDTNLSKRITHCNVYRASSSTDGDTEPTGYYRLISSEKLDSSWTSSTDAIWGDTKTKTITDTNKLFASYESRTSMPEVLEHTIPFYGLSTDLNSHLYVAKCSHQQINDASNYIFKSQAYKYDQFNWIMDFLLLPTTPTALKAFGGRLWAFDENNMHKIEPNNLFIEDTIEGVGCLSQRSIIVTDYGMCFCDKNNIYLHNGKNAQHISIPIAGDGDMDEEWGKMDSSWNPFVTWSTKYKSFIVLFKTTTGVYRMWSYNVVKQRWDLWKPFYTYGGSYLTQEPTDLFIGKNGEINICINNLIYVLFQDPRKKAWTWRSKDITLGQDTQIKRLNNFYVTGSPSGTLGNTSAGIYLKTDGSAVSGGNHSGTLTAFEVSETERSAKHFQWLLEGQTGSVDALGLVYRRKIITAEQ